MLNIVIPIAGNGSRFLNAGYNNPKPFIEFHNKFMAIHVAENIGISGAKYIFICQNSHLTNFGALFIEQLKKTHIKDFDIIPLHETTEGAACTILKVKELINNNDELLIVNGDQLLPFEEIQKSVHFFEKKEAHAGIMCFFNQDRKWSYVTINNLRMITKIEEKNPISDHATCGIYYLKHGKLFVDAVEKMIANNDRTNGEFYVAPALNYLISENRIIIPYFVNEMTGLGTPEDLEYFLNNT